MFIGAESIICPLGNSALETFTRMKAGEVSIKKQDNHEILSCFFSPKDSLLSLMIDSIQQSIQLTDKSFLIDHKTLLIVSTTKGEINQINKDINKTNLNHLSRKILEKFNWINKGVVLSTACVSGLQSLIFANDMLINNYYDNVIVCGGDLVSQFVLEGFKSFYALSNSFCKPFDKDRKGLNLGEGVSTIIMSKYHDLYNEMPLKFLGGCAINDANHISAPHREARGLIKSINNTLKICNVNSDNIDFVNAHGTATVYNDSMEAIAFSRLSLNSPINSFKGFFGHTLGAAGVIETAISIQSMRNNLLLKCQGFDNQDFDQKLNIITDNEVVNIDLILKTSSGFGGFNASVIIKKI